MELRLSKPYPGFEHVLDKTARLYKAYARIKWATSTQIRFELVEKPLSPNQAPFDVQSKVIRVLLHVDPRATIRTAKATYNGLADFERQQVPTATLA